MKGPIKLHSIHDVYKSIMATHNKTSPLVTSIHMCIINYHITQLLQTSVTVSFENIYSFLYSSKQSLCLIEMNWSDPVYLIS